MVSLSAIDFYGETDKGRRKWANLSTTQERQKVTLQVLWKQEHQWAFPTCRILCKGLGTNEDVWQALGVLSTMGCFFYLPSQAMEKLHLKGKKYKALALL